MYKVKMVKYTYYALQCWFHRWPGDSFQSFLILLMSLML